MSTISLSQPYSFGAARRQPSAGTRPSAPVRLTRRGQVVVVLLLLAVLSAAAVALGSATVASGEAGTVPETRVVKVQQGQTLWQIAAEANPSGDVRDTVDDIMRMNSLPSAGGLQMGTDLAVPVYE